MCPIAYILFDMEKRGKKVLPVLLLSHSLALPLDMRKGGEMNGKWCGVEWGGGKESERASGTERAKERKSEGAIKEKRKNMQTKQEGRKERKAKRERNDPLHVACFAFFSLLVPL